MVAEGRRRGARRRSIAGWSIAECKRSPGGCERIAKTPRASPQFLAAHPRVERVHYPGLPSHPQHDLARTADERCSAECFRSSSKAIAPLPWRCRTGHEIFTRATSLGGVESLIEHRQSIEGPDTLTPETLLRLSIGLEHPDDLIADLEQALRVAAPSLVLRS